VVDAILKIVQAALGWGFSLWKKKNDPSVAQRGDQIARDYDAKRKDLENR
jgi:hypothetical protein